MDNQPRQEAYFIGIELPPELDEQVAHLKQRLFDANEAALQPLLPHLTLLSPPSLRGIKSDELVSQVHDIAAEYLPLSITLERVEMFGERVCCIRAESLALCSLQSRLVELLPANAKMLQNKRKFSPHVTLVQVYSPETVDQSKAELIVAESIDLPRQFIVDTVTCFKRVAPRDYRPVTL